MRNLSDARRYDLLPAIAALLGHETKDESSMWREHALAALNEAICHSFATSGVSLVNHHQVAESFLTWQRDEVNTRGYCPVNWKW